MKIKAKVLGCRNAIAKLEYSGKIYFAWYLRDSEWLKVGESIDVEILPPWVEEAGGRLEEQYVGGGRDEYNQSLFHNLNDP